MTKKCNACGSEWNSNIESVKCPFCDHELKIESNEQNFNNLGDVLKYIVDEYGIGLYQNPTRLMSYISDLAPQFTNEQRLIKICAPSGVFEKAFESQLLNDSEKEIFIEKSISHLCNDYYISENAAKSLLEWLIMGLGWEDCCERLHMSNTMIKEKLEPVCNRAIALDNIYLENSPITNIIISEQDKSKLENTIFVSCGVGHIAGLLDNGTVVAVGKNGEGQCDVRGWENIVDISAGYFSTIGIKADGTVVDTRRCADISNWREIVSVSVGMNFILGLNANGDVFASGSNIYGQGEVSNWHNIIAIATGSSYSVGLKADGTVVATGENEYGQCDVSGWFDIISIAATSYTTIGLKKDGTVIVAGFPEESVENWSHIDDIVADAGNIFGLKKDGTVVQNKRFVRLVNDKNNDLTSLMLL